MARKFVVDDSEWDEVKYINGYAVFMGYLMMGVRGLGILVITWTTVVLLGGFVSDLGKKDFWCLTGITLVQTAGVFNFVLDETMSDLVHSGWGLLITSFATISKPFYKVKLGDIFLLLLAFFLSGIQALVLVIILCPVVVLFVFGIYISAGVGLWCLIQQDFGNTDGAANLNSSLQVLYSLAMAQGVLYGYKQIHAFGAKFGLAEFVAKEVLSMDKDFVTAYLEETVTGCEKDPSFATGRNLVTYALDLMMDAKSNDGFITGVKVLGTIIVKEAELSRKVLAKHLLTRPSCPFGHLVQRLLETLGPRSPYSGQIRLQAAMIVELVASSIHLEEHPEWIHYILSLLDTFEEYSWQPEEYSRHGNLPKEYERGWLLEKYEFTWLLGYEYSWIENYERESHFERRRPTVVSTTSEEGASSDLRDNYMRLVGQGFIVLRKLAVLPTNSIIIVNTEGLLAKMTTAPVNFMQLHSDDQHKLWNTIAQEYLKLKMQLAPIPRETGTKVRDEISQTSEAIIIIPESILECLECSIFLKIRIVQDLLHLSADASSIKASGSSCTIFTGILLLIFLLAEQKDYDDNHWNKSIKISRESSILAGEKKLCSNKELPLHQSVGYVIGDLAKALVSAEGISTRVQAARILEYLVYGYTKDDESLKILNIMVSVIPEVTYLCDTTGGAVIKAANNDVQPSSLKDVGIEMGGVSQRGKGSEQTSTSQQQTGDESEKTSFSHLLSSREVFRKDDEYFIELKKAMISVMPEVLKEMLGGGLTGEAGTKAANNVQPSSQDVDLEMGGVSGGDEGREQASSSQQQTGDEIGDIKLLRKELTDLCWTICWRMRWYGNSFDADVSRQLDEIAGKVLLEQGKPVKSYEELVREERWKYLHEG